MSLAKRMHSRVSGSIRSSRRVLHATLAFAMSMGTSGYATGAPADFDVSFGEGGVAKLERGVVADVEFLQDEQVAVLIRPAWPRTEMQPPDIVRRIGRDGVPDATFQAILTPASSGSVPSALRSIRDITVDSAGRIVVLHGYWGYPLTWGLLTRHLPDGRADSTFGDGGVSTLLSSLRGGVGTNLVVNASGFFFAHSSYSLDSGTSYVLRMHRNGLDVSYLGSNSFSRAETSLATGFDAYGPIALQPDGKVVALVEVPGQLRTVRIEGTARDPTYGLLGLSIVHMPEDAQFSRLFVTTDGRLRAVGIASAA